MLNLINELWAGTDAALDFAMQVEKRVAGMKAGLFGDGASMEQPEKLFAQSGNTAIVPIRGPIVNVDSPILKFFGVSSYPDIRRMMVAAAKDLSVEHILLDIDSGGGSVSGCADTGDLIARVNKDVKPVTAFADGNMLSAAYWLGSAAGQVFSGRTSMVGSIGVIYTHLDMTGQLAQEGIKPTIIRAGSQKALGHPLETLTPAAHAHLQAIADAAYEVFVEHVAECRDVSYATCLKQMADGQEFFGQAGQKAGLVDGISSFDLVISALNSAKTVDKRIPRK